MILKIHLSKFSIGKKIKKERKEIKVKFCLNIDFCKQLQIVY